MPFVIWLLTFCGARISMAMRAPCRKSVMPTMLLKCSASAIALNLMLKKCIGRFVWQAGTCIRNAARPSPAFSRVIQQG